MRQTHTKTPSRLHGRFAAVTVACLVLTLVRGPVALVPMATAASTFRPTLLVNTEAFLGIDDDDTTANVVLSFGDTLSKTLIFNRTNDRFEFNDDVYVAGMVRATGTVSGANLVVSGIGAGVVHATSTGVTSTVLGTTNYVPTWNGSGLSETSNIYDDGTNIGFFTDVPAKHFQVNVIGGSSAYSEDIASTAYAMGGSFQTGYEAIYGFDNNLSQGFSAPSGSNVYIGQDFGLGNEKNIRRVRVYGSPYSYGFNVKLQYSDDGSSWTDTNLVSISVDNVAGWSSWMDVNDYGAHRYWRFLDRQIEAHMQAGEIEMATMTDTVPGFVITSTGSVGIGTPSPDAKLDVVGTISGSALTVNGTSALNGTVNVDGTIFGDYIQLLDGGQFGDNHADPLYFEGGAASNVIPYSNNAYGLGNSTYRWSSGWFNSANLSSDLSVLGASSLTGNVGIGAANSTGKAALNVSGVMSGVTVYATKSFSGAGLSDCDGGTSKLLWDATTGRFSCGTVSSGSWSGTGALQAAFDSRYVNTAGDAMTGALTITSLSTGTKATLFSVDQMALGQLEGGAFFGRVGLTQNQWALSNAGSAWTAKDSSRAWADVAVSANGKIQAAVAISGKIYVSTDYGNTWTAKDSNRTWEAIAMSSDGKIQTAVVSSGQIYASDDYGNTWTAKESSRDWRGIAMSSDGKIQTATVYDGQIYVSSDYGDTWSAKAHTADWRDVSMSSDGKIQVAAPSGDQLYVSTDYGNTWSAKNSSRTWRGVATSSDGKIITATPYNNQIHVSTDYGNTWTAKDSTRAWYRVAMSTDGMIQTAILDNGQMYTSDDYGNTWTARESSRAWYGIAMSSDGKIQTAVVFSGQIYVSRADSYQYGNVGIGTSSPKAQLDVLGTISGSLITQNGAGNNSFMGNVGIGTTTPKAKLMVNGTLSGITLYATKSFSGAGLSDCDNATNSKLLWDATTGRFSCGTDETGGSSGGGLALSDADARYVNTHGDTMTGKLLLQNTSIHAIGSGTFVSGDGGDVVLTVKADSMQMNDLQQWTDSNDSVLVKIGADGSMTGGNATFGGNVSITGSNTTIGDSDSDNVSFGADITSNLNPEYGGMQALGNSSNRWNGFFYDADVSNNVSVGNTVNTYNLNVSNNTSLGNLSVSSAVSLTNYTNFGTGCTALETDGMGNLVCGSDDSGGGGGWGTDYFNITDGSTTETINESENVTFQDGTGIDVVVSGTDTVTINLNNSYANDMNQNVGTDDSVDFANLNVSGNTTLGSSTSYNVTFGALIASSLLPYSNVNYDLGNTSARWNVGYFRSMDLEGNGSQLSIYNTQDELIPQIIAKSVSSEASIVLRNNNASTDSVKLSTYHDDASLMNVENGTFSFGTNNTTHMIMDQLGNVSLGGAFVGFGSQANKAKLSVSGTVSGITLYATNSFSGAGLSDCDNATNSKLLWDATTGRFSCGTDQSGSTGGSSGGLSQTQTDERYVKKAGDTMTGALRIAVNGGNTNTLSLRVGGVMSGANLVVTGTGANPLLSTDTSKPAVRIGGSGMLLLGSRSDPGAAPANTAALYGTKIAGKTMPAARDNSATWAASPLQASLFGNLIMSITTGAGTSLTGYGTEVLSDTTVSHPTTDQTFGYMANFATAATTGDEAGTSSANAVTFRGSTTGANGFFYYARVGVVDTTSLRVFSGLSDKSIASMVGSDNPDGDTVGFQFSSNRSDTNWQFVTKDGSTQNLVNTGLAFTASKVYDLAFHCTKQCTSITWEIRNVTDGTSATGVTSSNLPTASTGLRIVLGVESLTTAAKNIRMQQLYVEADR